MENMENLSVLLNVNNKKVVLGTSYLHPISEIFVHEAELEKAGFVGDVLVDGLLANGFASNRFAKVYFDGQHFDYFNSVEVVETENVSDEVLNAVYTWFKENPKVVDQNAILPNAQRWILKKGTLLKTLA